MASKVRRPSRISQIVAPIVKIGRKLSRREQAESEPVEDDDDCEYQEIINTGLDIPLDFISQMKEAFSTFDKVEPTAKEYDILPDIGKIRVASSAPGSLDQSCGLWGGILRMLR